jgi:hypothetical protein
MYLVPPMDDEPPPEFVDFVAVHLAGLQHEAARLTGGPRHADEVYPDALADVACHWRRLRLRRRFTHRDAPGDYLTERLARRARQWREDQVYEVEVFLVRTPVRADRTSSVALRKAPLLPDTVRAQARPVAEASIAWSHAWRRARWHGIARTAAASILIFGGLVQALPTPPYS